MPARVKTRASSVPAPSFMRSEVTDEVAILHASTMPAAGVFIALRRGPGNHGSFFERVGPPVCEGETQAWKSYKKFEAFAASGSNFRGGHGRLDQDDPNVHGIGMRQASAH